MPPSLLDRLEEGISQILAFLPQLGMALGILLAGYAIARMIERGTDVFLHRIGFDRWMREGGVTEALERAGTNLDPSSVLAKFVYWIVILLAILLASNALGLYMISQLFTELLNYIPNVIAAVIILILGIMLGEFVKNLVLASAGAIRGVPILARAAKAAVIILAIFMALEQLAIAQDVVLVAFIAVVGAAALAAGIAFGLGGRDVAAELLRDWYERSQWRAVNQRAPGARHTGSPPQAAGSAAPPPPDPSDSTPPANEGEQTGPAQ
ncbi:MAG TPA: hypothetical protein VKZ58_08175 [Longimicrobiales bacterium]|nr:hypothetical protein [Longimicrobiales bacterium]